MLNRATRIGIAAMSALAESHGTDVPALTASQIARRRSIPQPFLAKVLTSLSRHELIRGTRGPGGGYVLARLAAEISLLSIQSQQLVSSVDLISQLGGGWDAARLQRKDRGVAPP